MRHFRHEVCGLKFSPFDDVVLASGGNDNKLFIWDLRKTSTNSSLNQSGLAVHRGRLSTTPFSNLTNPSANVDTAVDVLSTAGDLPLGLITTEKSTSAATPGPLFHLTEHRAAVRGLAWSPHTRGLLASGGGRQDPVIRFWNTSLGYKIDQLQCHAQVSATAFTHFWHSSRICSSGDKSFVVVHN
jgi:cell division cycle 20-like protein 1 (cofactor of APC complex)